MKTFLILTSILLLTISSGWSNESFETQVTKVLKSYGLEQINTEFNHEEIKRQQQLSNNKIQFSRALKMAINSFINDDENIESPKALLIEFAFEELEVAFNFPYPTEVQQKSEEMVKKFMLAKGSLLELQELSISAENGESPEDYWIFRLYMGSLSDHQYWAIVDRSGNIQPYNYGFN